MRYAESTKYPGIANNSNAERAIEIVLQEPGIEGPRLAARLGLSTYEMSAVRRAVQLGYLAKHRSQEPGKATINVYLPGPKLESGADLGPSRQSISLSMLQAIAEHGTFTAIALGERFDMEPGLASTRLKRLLDAGFVKKRLVDSRGRYARKLVTEFFDADVDGYLAHLGQAAARSIRQAAPDPAPDEKPANLVPSRTPPEFRPLNFAKLMQRVDRPGAWDFREIPSKFAEDPCV